MKTASSKEKGQALILIILAIVGLMGFAALSVDVGRVYAERRRAQSAADEAVMAAAFAGVRGFDWNAAGWASLTQNDYTPSPGWTMIDVINPPDSGPYSGDTNYYMVRITTTVDQVFGQFVRPGPMQLTVESVAHGMPVDSISPGNAIVAMGQNVCPGIVFNGGANTIVNGGSIYSNSNGNGPGSCYSGVITGSSGSIDITGGELRIAQGWNNTGGATVNPAAIPYSGHITFPDVTEPVCPNTTVVTPNNTTKHMSPGTYNASVNITHGDWTMDPGMYCFNADFTVNGGSLTGNGVMIVMYHGTLTLGGNAIVTLMRPNDIEDGALPSHNHFGGMLIFMPKANDGGIDLSGSTGTQYTGTIYAPGPRVPSSKEKCNLGGTGDTMGLSANVMCYTVGVAGNSTLNITYNADENYRNPPSIELAQ